MMEDLINKTILALNQVLSSRYFATERGFATEFQRHLIAQLENSNLFPEQTILEAEVQKRNAAHYGITQRPDILIHIPLKSGVANDANENNFAVFAFKQKGNRARAEEDFEKLEEMFSGLHYRIGFFINIASYPSTQLEQLHDGFRTRIHEFSIDLNENQVRIQHAFFTNNEISINECQN